TFEVGLGGDGEDLLLDPAAAGVDLQGVEEGPATQPSGPTIVLDEDLLESGDLDAALAEAEAAVAAEPTSADARAPYEGVEDEDEFGQTTQMLSLDEIPEEVRGILDDEEDVEATDSGIEIVTEAAEVPVSEVEASAPLGQAEAAAAPVAPTKAPEEIADELEEAEFFIEQGLLDEAREVLNGILEAVPGHEEALALLGRLDQGDGGALEAGAADLAAEAPAPGLSDEGTEAGFDEFDLAGELAEELASLEEESAAAAPLDDFQVSADDVFEEFKKGVAKTVSAEDADTHYDLGIAYREMGLLNDALGEFQLAAAQPSKRLDALSMKGECHRELGQFDEAVASFQEALAIDGLGEESRKAILFDIGLTYEQAGQVDEAHDYYRQVFEMDPSFRDVADRLGAAGDPGHNGSDPDAPPGKAAPRKAGKVGYV
ncbi:MAG: tetratricopeptide repeat protein, partial [Deltaproteobacteria bacterium]